MKSFTDISIPQIWTQRISLNNLYHMMAMDVVRQNDHQRLFCVSSTTGEYRYCGKTSFCEVLDNEYHALERNKSGNQSQYIIFFDIDEQTFLEDFADSSRKQVYHPYFEYIPNLHLLLIKMVTEVHEQAHKSLNRMIIRKFAFMNNLDLQLHMTGQAEKGSNGRKKKADKSYRPETLPDGCSNYWYSVLIEAAYPEKRSKLANDARWWLIESAGDVKTVVTIAVHQTTKEITIEAWRLVSRPTKQEKNKRVPDVTQRVVVTQNSDEIRVKGGPLTIPIYHFFLRDKGAGEGDLFLDEDDLKIVATSVWEVHSNV